MKPIIAKLLSIFLLSTLLLVNYFPTFSQSQPTNGGLEQSLEGSLTIIWDESSVPGLEPTYYLTSFDGTRTELELIPEILSDFKAFIVDQHNLIVFGFWDSDPSKFIVRRFAETSSPDTERNIITPLAEPGWTINGSKITGNTPWITVLCKFPDIADEPYDMNYYLDMYGSEYPSLDHYWREASDNMINLSGSIAVGWYTLPYPSTEYAAGTTPASARDDCLAAADPDVDFSQYYGVNMMFNHNIWSSFAWAGCGTYLLEGEYRWAGFTTTFPGENGGLANLAHEMGHGYCLPHSFINGGDDPYRNNWDLMSNSYSYTAIDPTYGMIPKHTIALNKYNLGWIENANVLIVNSPFEHQITLGRSAQPLTDDYRMIKIIINDNVFYTLETRQNNPWYDIYLPESAVIIHKYDHTTNKISFVDAFYNNETYSCWTVGKTYIDPQYGLTFTVVSATDSGFVIDLSVTDLTPFESCTEQSSIPESECNTLVAIYNALDGPNWVSAPGWLIHPDPCIWPGVTCADGVVTELNLITELDGTIPADISGLTNLDYLRLKSENLTGEIPASIGELSKLRSLELENNNLSGSIPPELGDLSNLEYLSLGNNQLSGSIPPELGQLNNLKVIDIWFNQFSGSIPPELGNLTQLSNLNLAHNHLSGVLPPELGNLSNVSSIIFDNNSFYGLIPMTFTQLMNLRGFAFRNTFLCEPDDPDYQYWHETYIPEYGYANDGAVCVESLMDLYLPLIIK